MQLAAHTAVTLTNHLSQLRDAANLVPYPSLAQRRQWLDGLARLLQQHQHELAAAISADFGHRSVVETRLAEVFPTLAGIRHARRQLATWLRPQRRPVSLWFQPARARLLPQPLGVVGIIVPWNYPLFLALGPLVAALAAGNRALLKMSELTPHTGTLLATLLSRYLGDDVVRVVTGDAGVARAFASLPFDHLLFTGSTRVGREVMQAAAANLVPVTLELGGKSPVLVAPGADLQHAARRIVAGKLLNAGQTCVAPDYVLVPRPQQAALVAALRDAATRAYPTLADNTDYSAIISVPHYERLQALAAQAQAAGAVLTTINPANETPAALAAARKLPLTLIEQAPPDSRVRQEEIFGPLLPVIGYDSLEQAVELLRQQPRPLAMYLFDHDKARIERLLRDTIAGGVTVNDTLLHVAQEALPFGGVGASGMGHYHGHEGFLTFSKLKPVLYQSRLSGTWLTAPPYGNTVKLLLRWMIGR
ncbi:coniferyl aldehyde dehydrogenase [Vogesella indigofera]|uniref:Aldehyde dehydrogenase n=1 Tax=Vogesella indigofera TaxID=45465 RepID=A0ABT5I3Z3_VOGIN|nr:coniferyl aldehyde dehydrogenase [Vogesella indigofera]MDC7690206.1 coniferyl aldehyde dehydrogenase [Vogesella indigofera]